MVDFYESYFKYVERTEPARVAHRWVAFSIVGALGFGCHISFGPYKIRPNMYSMLVGGSGSSKSTAIKFGKDVLKRVGFDALAPDVTSGAEFQTYFAKRTQHLMELLAPMSIKLEEMEKIYLENEDLFDEMDTNLMVVADEAMDFLGRNDTQFFSLLGSMWDKEGLFKTNYRKSKGEVVINPVLGFLGGCTPAHIDIMFPDKMFDLGFPSRVLFVGVGKRAQLIDWPEAPGKALIKPVDDAAKSIYRMRGEMKPSPGAKSVLAEIYAKWKGFNVARLKPYGSRRQVHLLKCCMVSALGRGSMTIDERDVVLANSALTYLEAGMEDAVGFSGTVGFDADLGRKVLDYVKSFPGCKACEIQNAFQEYFLADPTKLLMIIGNLKNMDNIKGVPPTDVEKENPGYRDGHRYYPKPKDLRGNDSLHCDFNLLWEAQNG